MNRLLRVERESLDGKLCEHCGEGHTALTFEDGQFASNCDICCADCDYFLVERLNSMIGAPMLTDEERILLLGAKCVLDKIGMPEHAFVLGKVYYSLRDCIPDGWQLVPLEPTEEMRDAAGESIYGHSKEKAQEWAKTEKFESCAYTGIEAYKAILRAVKSKGDAS